MLSLDTSVFPADAFDPSAFVFDSLTPSSPPNTATFSYVFPDAEPSPSAAPRKKRSHGRARPPGHIPRPPNAFIIFRTEYIRSMATHSTPEMSKNLGLQWKQMSMAEKRPWIEKARAAKEEHMKQYPGYKYKPVHPRDSEGRCIRKRRKPNQPRVKTTIDESMELLSASSWKSEVDFPSNAPASDGSVASSPPPSPSPFLHDSLPQPSCLPFRRSSSVPLPCGDNRNYFGMGPEQSTSSHQLPSNSFQTLKFGKRPSTSMDFCNNTAPIPEYTQNYPYVPPPNEYPQWRPNHRRSLSAPMFSGDTLIGQFVNISGQDSSRVQHDLTPINPVFGNVFAKFSWDAPPSVYAHPIIPPQHPYTGLDIPKMTASPSNGTVTPPTATPGDSPSPFRPEPPMIQHPAPVSTFDFSAFQAQFGEFGDAHQDGARTTGVHSQTSELENALGFVSRQHPVYPDTAAREHQFYSTRQPQGRHPVEREIPSAEVQHTSHPLAADINGYEEGLRQLQPMQTLDFNELIVEGY